MNYLELSKDIEEYVIKMYKDFHENPEVAGKEERTMSVIEIELSNMNIEYRRIPKGGVVGKINPGKGGKKVALRADIDALPMNEDENNLLGKKSCCSKVDNISHMCGHDGHTAMLLGAAKILQDNRDRLDGEVLLLFEQGEEVGYGMLEIANTIVDEKPDTIWGIHLQSGVPSGKISVNKGPRMSSAIGIRGKIIGKSGHGSRPDLSRSPLDCFVDLYSQLKNVRMDYTSPFHPITFSLGQVNMGTVGNIIPDELEFNGTFRYTNYEQGKLICKRVLDIYETIPKLHGCEIELYRQPKSSDIFINNNTQCSEIAEQAVIKSLGREAVYNREPWMGSESFGIYQKYAPGVFAFLGINNPDKGTGEEHHNSKFEIDVDVLKLGVAATVQYTEDFMSSDIEIAFEPTNMTPLELIKTVI